MNSQHTRIWITLWAISSASALSAPIRNLVFTEVIKDVAIFDVATKKEVPAKVGDTLVPPNVLKTGADSRAELVAEDKTVTRVGSNTVFSMDANSRDVNLGQGSVLFHSQTGKGGGNIKSAGATASVLGTTLIVGANPSGGFKTMLLEGKGQITGPGGSQVKLAAGQLSFSMPGQKPSVPLNFALKGQVGSSKLVNGFSKPVASIAKIDAAIAKQEKDRASGKLGDTGLVIGDRPDTAFKIDPSVIREITIVTHEQVTQPPQDLPSLTKLDPRYVQAVAKSLSLTSQFGESTDAQHIFGIDGSGGNGGKGQDSYALPKNIPGNQEGHGLHSMLIGKDIEFTSSIPGYFIPTRVDIEADTNHAAVVALNNLSVGTSLEFLGLSAPYADQIILVNPDGKQEISSVEKWRPLTQLLLSAGNTITMAQSTTLRAAVPLFEIFAGGGSFSPDVNFTFTPGTPSNTPVIDWTGTGLVNEYSSDSSLLTGRIRLTAPSISLTDSAIRASSTESIDDITKKSSPSVEVVATDGDLTVKNNGVPVKLPLGFPTPEDLSITGYSVKLTSKTKGVSLTNVPIAANHIEITAGTDITLDRVRTSSDFTITAKTANRTFTATAQRNLTIIDSDIQAVANLGDVNQLLSINLTATTGDVTIGNEPAAPEITTKQVIETRTVFTTQAVNITAGGKIDINGLTHKAADSTKSSFTANARDKVSLNNVDLSQTQTVAIGANTVVLTDTQFKDGSTVNLTSQQHLVAANPGTNQGVKNGMVNFIRNVFYGNTEVKLPNTSDMNHQAFQSAAQQAGKNLSGINIK
ncbi:MAG: FecR family protein [Verrucomicrobiota bacterium]